MMELDKSQQEAVERAQRGEDIVVTGSAGMGKTVVIGRIADALDGECKIMAPTGKAAAQIKKATGHYASTVHRALGWDGETFRTPQDLNTTVIVDESSMMDSWLMANLIKRKPMQLILVGDAAQLPPVGRGQPFHDLVRCRPEIVCTLDICHRNKASVHKAANLVRIGRSPSRHKETSEGESWAMRDTGGPARTEIAIADWAERGAIDPHQDIVVAARYGKDENDEGNITSLNQTLMNIFNPHDAGEPWAVHDRVICTKNFPKLDLWNGDIGTVTAVDVDGNLWVELDRSREDSQHVLCAGPQKRELRHAYCLSVHKSQGSQFRRVVVVCLKKHAHMLDRALLYTAITRAQKGCVVCGNLRTFYAGINNTKNRRTVLQTLLEDERENYDI